MFLLLKRFNESLKVSTSGSKKRQEVGKSKLDHEKDLWKVKKLE